MERLADGAYRIDDAISIDGEGISPFVFASGWLLEIVEIKSGEFYFFSDSAPVRSPSNRFGVFYPPFTVVRSYVRKLKGRITGVGSTEVISQLPKEPVIFETEHKGAFESPVDAIGVLAAAKNLSSIAVNTKPSLLSKRVKKLIDENYLVYPSIARIAERLGVSHEHVSRQFKRDFLMSPSEYLHHLRVADATFRLSTGEEIIDISQEVGYNDLSRFYKQFRRATQTSPARCRTILKSRNAAT